MMKPKFDPIIQDHSPIHLRIASDIRTAIRRGDLPVGEKLALESLGKSFGVSRMPVREALIRLEREGLVAFHPRRGAVVAGVTDQDLVEITHLRRMLEGDAIRLAVGRFQLPDIERAQAALDEARLTTDIDCQADLHWQFHRAIYAPCNRPMQLEMIDTLHANVDRFFRMEWREAGLRSSWIAEHERILGLIGEGEVDRAAQAIDDHILEASIRVQARAAGADTERPSA